MRIFEKKIKSKHVDVRYVIEVACGRTFAALEQTSNNELLITLIITQAL